MKWLPQVPKFFQTREFKKLNEEWRKKLAKSGFEDQEDSKENLQEYDRRSIAFENRDSIEQFFSKLGHFINNTPNLPASHRRVLLPYLEGKRAVDIGKQLKVSRRWVHRVLNRYKKKILSSEV